MFEELNNYLHIFLNEVRHLNPYVGALVLFAVSTILGAIFQYGFSYGLRSYARRTSNNVIKALARHIGPRTTVLFPLVFFYLFQPFIRLPNETHDIVLFRTVQTLVIMTFGWLLMKLTHVFEDIVSDYYQDDIKNPYKARKVQTQIQFVRRVLSTLIVILVFAVILLTFPNVREIGATLLTSAGVAGIIIGIAAQKSIGNLLAGMQIAITQPIKIGDSLLVENEWGIVEEITLTYVVVMIWDKRRLILPINYFIDHPFQNWTRSSSELLGVIMLFVDYSLPVDALRHELTAIIEKEPLWDHKVQVVQVLEATEKVMQLRILVSSYDAPSAFDLRCSVREKLIGFVQREYPGALPKNRISLTEEDARENSNSYKFMEARDR